LPRGSPDQTIRSNFPASRISFHGLSNRRKRVKLCGRTMKHLLGGIWLIALALIYPQAGHTTNPTVETILREVQRTEEAREAGIRDMLYTAETQVIEWEDASRRTVKSETLSVRRVYVHEPDKIRNEYLSMTIDGRELSQKEIRRELAKQQRGGRRNGNGEFQSPFSAEAAPLYNFEIKGMELFEEQAVWVVEFTPKQAEENLFSGSAYISQEDYQPVYVEMAPAVLPRVLEEFSMKIRFAAVEGYRLPSVFSMDMRVRVSFLVTLADRTLSIEDYYSDYRLNVGLDDDIFTGD
jgi:hypothetical protein